MRPETITMEVPTSATGTAAEGKLEVVDRFREKTLQVTGYASGKWKVQGTLDGAALGSLVPEHFGTLAFESGTKTITRSSGDWTSSGKTNYSRPGTKITIRGATLNDGTYTVASATATDLVVDESLSDEAASSTERVGGYYANWSDIGSEISGDGIVGVDYAVVHLRLLCTLDVGALDEPPTITFAGFDSRAR